MISSACGSRVISPTAKALDLPYPAGFLYNFPMRVYFVRHGESEANVLEVIANRGWRDGLTEKGRRQAYELATRLQEEVITEIYCSPLKRAVETANIVGTKLGLPVTVTDGLREFDCGELEGRGDPESWTAFRTLVQEWLDEGNLAAEDFWGGKLFAYP